MRSAARIRLERVAFSAAIAAFAVLPAAAVSQAPDHVEAVLDACQGEAALASDWERRLTGAGWVERGTPGDEVAEVQFPERAEGSLSPEGPGNFFDLTMMDSLQRHTEMRRKYRNLWRDDPEFLRAYSGPDGAVLTVERRPNVVLGGTWMQCVLGAWFALGTVDWLDALAVHGNPEAARGLLGRLFPGPEAEWQAMLEERFGPDAPDVFDPYVLRRETLFAMNRGWPETRVHGLVPVSYIFVRAAAPELVDETRAHLFLLTSADLDPEAIH